MLVRMKNVLAGGKPAQHINWDCIELHEWATTWCAGATRSTSLRRRANQYSQTSPIPEDVLLLVFHAYLDVCLGDSSNLGAPLTRVRLNYLRLHAPFLLSAICHSWRTLVLGSPSLWSYIGSIAIKTDTYRGSRVASKHELVEMRSVADHSVTMLQLILDRSRQAPLHVVMPHIWTPLLNSAELPSFEPAADFTRRAFTLLRAHKDRWQTWEVCIIGASRPVWWRLALSDRLNTDLNNAIIRLPNLKVWTLDHHINGLNSDLLDDTMSDPCAELMAAPKLQVVRTGAGNGMEILCSSLLESTSEATRDPAVLPATFRSSLCQLAIQSHTVSQQRFVVPSLRAAASALVTLEISLSRHGAPFVPSMAPFNVADATDGPKAWHLENYADGFNDRRLEFPSLLYLRWCLCDLPPARIHAWTAYLGLTSANRLRIISIVLGYRASPLATLSEQLAGFNNVLLEAREHPLELLEVRNAWLQKPHRAMFARARTAKIKLVACQVDWDFFTVARELSPVATVEVQNTDVHIPQNSYHAISEAAQSGGDGFFATLLGGTFKPRGAFSNVVTHRISHEKF